MTLPIQYTDDGRHILEEIALSGISHAGNIPVGSTIVSDGTKWIVGQVTGGGTLNLADITQNGLLRKLPTQAFFQNQTIPFPRTGREITAYTGTFGQDTYTVTPLGSELQPAHKALTLGLTSAESAMFNGTTGGIQLTFSNAVAIDQYEIAVPNDLSNWQNAPKSWQFQAFDGALWQTLSTVANAPAWSSGENRVFPFVNVAFYTDYRLNVSDTYTTGGTGPSENFPRVGAVMSANTTVISGQTYIATASDGGSAYLAFNGQLNGGNWWLNNANDGWVQLQYPTARVFQSVAMQFPSVPIQHSPASLTIEGSNNGTSWTTLATASGLTWVQNETKTFAISSITAYSYIRFTGTSNGFSLVYGEITMTYSTTPPASFSIARLRVSGINSQVPTPEKRWLKATANGGNWEEIAFTSSGGNITGTISGDTFSLTAPTYTHPVFSTQSFTPSIVGSTLNTLAASRDAQGHVSLSVVALTLPAFGGGLAGTSGNGLTVTSNSVSLALAAFGAPGAMPGLTFNTAQFLRADGQWAAPSTSSFTQWRTQVADAPFGNVLSQDFITENGILRFVAGSNISISQTSLGAGATAITISATSGGGSLTGTSGNGLTVTPTTVSLALATTSSAGAMPAFSGNSLTYLRGDGFWGFLPSGSGAVNSVSTGNGAVLSVTPTTGSVVITPIGLSTTLNSAWNSTTKTLSLPVPVYQGGILLSASVANFDLSSLGGGSGSNTIEVRKDGAVIGQASILNFTGSGVFVSTGVGYEINIPGGIGGGVTSFNSTVGAISLVNGTNTTITNLGGGTFRVDATAGSASLAGFSGNGLSVTSNTVSLAMASLANAGAMPVLSGVSTQYLNGLGQWTTPSIAVGVTSFNSTTGAITLINGTNTTVVNVGSGQFRVDVPNMGLPPGTLNNTLRHNGTAWEPTNTLSIGTTVDVNNTSLRVLPQIGRTLGIGTPLWAEVGLTTSNTLGFDAPEIQIRGNRVFLFPQLGAAYDLSLLSETRAFVLGDMNSKISFFGGAAQFKQSLPGAATDPASTQALVNAIRTLLINYSLAT